MKRMSFLPMGAVVLLLAFTACSEELTEVPSSTLKQIVMTATDFETEDESRTNFQITSAGAEFSWAANDTVGIFPNEGAQAYFPMTSGAGTKSANFTGGGWALKDASTYAAYYPFIGNFYLNKNAIPVDFTGQVQTGDASTAHLGAYDYMAAIPATPKNGNVNFAFKHLGALVQLKLTVPQTTIFNSVTLTTESNAFAVKGTVDVMASAPSITSVTAVKEVNLELNELATTKANQIVTLYMMLPPVDLSTKILKAVVKTSNGTEEVALESKNFQAGKAYALSGSLKDPNGGAVAGNGTYKDGVVSIAVAGTMKKLLGNDYLDITSLKVVGPINGDDVFYLNKMLCSKGKLATLDLSEATIVEGGEGYPTKNNELGDYIFSHCTNLKNIILPNNCIKIGYRAFAYCESLNSVIFNNGITVIGEEAFMGCYGLTSIDIGDAVTDIEMSAFRECRSLTSVVIGNSVKYIGYQAFWDCVELRDVTIGTGIISIGYYAFGRCENIKNVYISDLSHWCRIDFAPYSCNPLGKGAKLFVNNKLLTELIIPDDITKINPIAFYACSSLKQVVIHDKVTEVGESSFDCCPLEKVIIGKGMKKIDRGAFSTKTLKECYSYATTPPSIYTNFPQSFSSEADAILYVPAGCEIRYSKYNVLFKNIIEMD